MWLITSSTGTFTFLPDTPPPPRAPLPPQCLRPSPGTATMLMGRIQAAKESLATREWDRELPAVKLRRKGCFINSKAKPHWHGKNLRASLTAKGWSFSRSGSETENASPRCSWVTWVKDSLGVCCWLWKVEVESLEVLECEGNGSDTPTPSTFFLEHPS